AGACPGRAGHPGQQRPETHAHPPAAPGRPAAGKPGRLKLDDLWRFGLHSVPRPLADRHLDLHLLAAAVDDERDRLAGVAPAHDGDQLLAAGDGRAIDALDDVVLEDAGPAGGRVLRHAGDARADEVRPEVTVRLLDGQLDVDRLELALVA